MDISSMVRVTTNQAWLQHISQLYIRHDGGKVGRRQLQHLAAWSLAIFNFIK